MNSSLGGSPKTWGELQDLFGDQAYCTHQLQDWIVIYARMARGGRVLCLFLFEGKIRSEIIEVVASELMQHINYRSIAHQQRLMRRYFDAYFMEELL